MPRPRRPFSQYNVIQPNREPWLKDVLPGVLGVRQERRWDVSNRTLRYPTLNGTQDPLTYLLVLDSLMNMHPDVELRAVSFAEWLSTHVEGYVWTSHTVGKVLSDLCEAFEDVLGAGNGLLTSGKDYRGAWYLFNRSKEAARVAYALREDLQRLSEAELKVRQLGRKTDTLGSPLMECPSVRGKFEEVV